MSDGKSVGGVDLAAALHAEAARLGIDTRHASDRELGRLHRVLPTSLVEAIVRDAAAHGLDMVEFIGFTIRPYFETGAHDCERCARRAAASLRRNARGQA